MAYICPRPNQKDGIDTRFCFAHFLTEGQIATASNRKSLTIDYNPIPAYQFMNHMLVTLQEIPSDLSRGLQCSPIVEFLAYQEACEQIYDQIMNVPCLQEFLEITGIVKPKEVEADGQSEETINDP